MAHRPLPRGTARPRPARADRSRAGHRPGLVIVSGTISEDTAVETLSAGAHDYVLKDNLKRLGPAVDHAVREARLARQKELGIVPSETELAARNPGVQAWADLSEDERRLVARVQAAAAEVWHFSLGDDGKPRLICERQLASGVRHGPNRFNLPRSG